MSMVYKDTRKTIYRFGQYYIVFIDRNGWQDRVVCVTLEGAMSVR